jgi:hypothetical protein
MGKEGWEVIGAFLASSGKKVTATVKRPLASAK